MDKDAKFFIIVLLLLLLSVSGFIMALAMAIFGENFYFILTIILYLILIVLVPFSIMKDHKRNLVWGLWIALSLVVSGCVAVKESINAYHRNIETLDDRRLDLSVYEPFREGTLAAGLDQQATLSLTDSLPLMDGATALYPVYAAFARAVYPEKDYPVHDSEVACTNTPQAYQALINGSADIIFVNGPSRQQLEAAEHESVEMILTPIGREAFVFFVNSRNPVTGLTTAQLKDIYSGRITDWKDVGGESGTIRAFQRVENSGSQTAFLHFMDGTDIMVPPQNDVIQGMGMIIDRTASYRNYPDAIGYSFRFFAESMNANDGIKLLAIDGVYPTTETIRTGEYPLADVFYAVTRADSQNPNVRRLLDWILSSQGQELISRTGYNPL